MPVRVCRVFLSRAEDSEMAKAEIHGHCDSDFTSERNITRPERGAL